MYSSSSRRCTPYLHACARTWEAWLNASGASGCAGPMTPPAAPRSPAVDMLWHIIALTTEESLRSEPTAYPTGANGYQRPGYTQPTGAAQEGSLALTAAAITAVAAACRAPSHGWPCYAEIQCGDAATCGARQPYLPAGQAPCMIPPPTSVPLRPWAVSTFPPTHAAPPAAHFLQFLAPRQRRHLACMPPCIMPTRSLLPAMTHTSVHG